MRVLQKYYIFITYVDNISKYNIINKKKEISMLTEAKALYQVKLIIDYLPKEEYDLIPQEIINYVEENFEYDENIKVNPNIPLENQDIADKTYDILKKIVKGTEDNKKKIEEQELQKKVELEEKARETYDAKMENIRLNNIIKALQEENKKIPKAKELLENYKDALEKKDIEIEQLKRNNQQLYMCIQKLPKIIRKLFIKGEDVKYLNS